MKLTGSKEVIDSLKDLDAKLTTSILRTFCKKALKEKALDSFQNSAISSRAKQKMTIAPVKGEPIAVRVGVTKEAYFERWLQKGTNTRITKKGWNRGSMKRNFKLKQAVQSVIDPIIEYTNNELGTEVEKILEKRIKATKRRTAKLRQ